VSGRPCAATSPVYWTRGMLRRCQDRAAISPLATIASNTWWASTRRPSRAQSRNLVQRRHLSSSRASLMAMARLLAAGERPRQVPGSCRRASTPPHLDPAASPACWWQGPAPVPYRAKGLELVACEGRSRRNLRPVAPTPWPGAAAPRLRRQIPATPAPHVVDGSLPPRGLDASISSPSCRCGIPAHR